MLQHKQLNIYSTKRFFLHSIRHVYMYIEGKNYNLFDSRGHATYGNLLGCNSI